MGYSGQLWAKMGDSGNSWNISAFWEILGVLGNVDTPYLQFQFWGQMFTPEGTPIPKTLTEALPRGIPKLIAQLN